MLGYLQQSSSSDLPEHRPEPATAPSHAVGPSIQWLEGKFDDLKAEVRSEIVEVKDSLSDIRRVLAISCRAAAEPPKRRHDE